MLYRAELLRRAHHTNRILTVSNAGPKAGHHHAAPRVLHDASAMAKYFRRCDILLLSPQSANVRTQLRARAASRASADRNRLVVRTLVRWRTHEHVRRPGSVAGPAQCGADIVLHVERGPCHQRRAFDLRVQHRCQGGRRARRGGDVVRAEQGFFPPGGRGRRVESRESVQHVG